MDLKNFVPERRVAGRCTLAGGSKGGFRSPGGVGTAGVVHLRSDLGIV